MQPLSTYSTKIRVNKDGRTGRIVKGCDGPVGVQGVDVLVNGCQFLGSNVRGPGLSELVQ